MTPAADHPSRRRSTAALLLALLLAAPAAAAAEGETVLWVLWYAPTLNAMHERTSADAFFDPAVGAKSFGGVMEKPLLERVGPLVAVLPDGVMQRFAVPMLKRGFEAEGLPLTRVETYVANGVDARRLMDRIATLASEGRSRDLHIVLSLDPRIVDDGDMLYLRGYMTATRGGRGRQFASGALHWFSAPIGGPKATRVMRWSEDDARPFLATLDTGLGRIAHLTKLRMEAMPPTTPVEQVRYGDHIAVRVDAVETAPRSVVYAIPPWVLVEEPRRGEQGYLPAN